MFHSNQPRSLVRRVSGALAILLIAISLIAPATSRAAGIVYQGFRPLGRALPISNDTPSSTLKTNT